MSADGCACVCAGLCAGGWNRTALVSASAKFPKPKSFVAVSSLLTWANTAEEPMPEDDFLKRSVQGPLRDAEKKIVALGSRPQPESEDDGADDGGDDDDEETAQSKAAAKAAAAAAAGAPNVKTTVVNAGVVYGVSEGALHFLFKVRPQDAGTENGTVCGGRRCVCVWVR